MKPDLPCRNIQASCGSVRCTEYQHLVEAYDQCADAVIPSSLVKMAFLIAQTPAAEHVPRFWEALRAWNASSAGIKVIVCQRCGEFRADKIQGESSVSQHWVIVGFEPPHTCLMATKNCSHSSFKIVCLTCGMEINNAIVKIVDPPAEPTPTEASHVN